MTRRDPLDGSIYTQNSNQGFQGGGGGGVGGRTSLSEKATHQARLGSCQYPVQGRLSQFDFDWMPTESIVIVDMKQSCRVFQSVDSHWASTFTSVCMCVCIVPRYRSGICYFKLLSVIVSATLFASVRHQDGSMQAHWTWRKLWTRHFDGAM